MWLSVTHGAPAPFALLRWRIMERFGWTPAEFDSLSMEDLHEILQIDDALGKQRPKTGRR